MNAGLRLINSWRPQRLLVHSRWPWHVLFWTGYILFTFWRYYLTVKYSKSVYLEYMLLSEIIFAAIVYFTLWLYREFFDKKKYAIYFLAGALSWLIYLCTRIIFQFYYLQDEPSFQASAGDIFISNITFTLVCFLFVTSCKYFKDGYIRQQFEAERKEQQLMAEINNLKSQIAPHFLFNTLNNLYGLAVEKSDKLPGLMLRLSDLLRHSLYETQKPLVPITEEIHVLRSYIELESVRLEDDLKLEFDNKVPADAPHLVAPLVLIVFVENAFKHAKLVEGKSVNIYIRTALENNCFSLVTRNNYNAAGNGSSNGIGLLNVKRRLEVLYPDLRHQLLISKDESFYTVSLTLQLVKPA
jgi:two-component system, LytTR family, sensor histidine kinase LytS